MNDPVSRLSRGGSINKSLRNYLSKRWFEFCFLLHEKMVYYSGEELMLLRDSKYIIRRDTDKRKTPACHRQAGYNWIRGNILRDRSQKPFIFRQITASVSFSFGNYRSKTDCWPWPTNFPFRYSVGEIPTYCLKYLPKKDWVEKFSSEAISLILKSEERSICLASAMTMRMIHCRAEMPDFSLMIAEK